jgi:hypothetical protein
METPSAETLRQGISTMALAIVAAAAIIGFSLPDAPRGPRYQAMIVDGKIVRLDTRNGNIVACDFRRCVRVLGNGKHLARNSEPGLAVSATVPAPATNAAPALPPSPEK